MFSNSPKCRIGDIYLIFSLQSVEGFRGMTVNVDNESRVSAKPCYLFVYDI